MYLNERLLFSFSIVDGIFGCWSANRGCFDFDMVVLRFLGLLNKSIPPVYTVDILTILEKVEFGQRQATFVSRLCSGTATLTVTEYGFRSSCTKYKS